VLTISSGHSARYLTDAVAVGRENYYTGAVAAGEPPGRWYGAGAEKLGLTGLVDTLDMTALYEHFVDPRDPGFRDPAAWNDAQTLGHRGRAYVSEDDLYQAALEKEPDATAERRAELLLEAGKRARRNVSFLDATFSVPKSVTVMHTAFEALEVKARAAGNEDKAAAWGDCRQAVEDAIWAGNNASIDYLAQHAGYSRVGHHGGAAGRFIDAHDFVVGQFFQHDSRDHDPQLHIHNAILNRVQGSDGEWRTLDSRAIHRFRAAAAAVGERTMEEHITRALHIPFAARTDNNGREAVGIPDHVNALFSSRRRAITGKTATLVEAFESKFGRAPNSLELDRLQRQATFATRKSKTYGGETAEQRIERWDRELRAEVAGGLEQVAYDVLALRQPPTTGRWSRTAVIETALADVQATRSAWTRSDLTRAISNALPDRLGDLDGADIRELLDGLTEQALELVVQLDAPRPAEAALPEELRLDNGRSVYEAPGGRLYATPEHVHTERLLTAAATAGGAPALTIAEADRYIDALAVQGIELGADQAAAVRGVLTSGAQVETLVGPAGTGKSFVVGALAKAWADPDLWRGEPGRVVGLATSQIATEVLTGEGLDARNVARWLATQARLVDGRGIEGDEAWRLRAGDLVVVDESAMSSTADLAAIHAHAQAAGAKVLLTGDHRQLAAVGAGGAMEMLATAGARHELTEARRFANPWEADASLRLRDADPTALADYHKHGRLLDSGTIEAAEESAAQAWLADTLTGRHALLVVDTNEQAARISAALRGELVRLGKVAEHGVPLGLQGTYAGVGDLVQARRNAWHLAGLDGNRRGPINREMLQVLQTRDDGSVIAAPVIGRGPDGVEFGEPMTLPAEYVSEHLALGYASTAHAAQGLTVDTSHVVATGSTGAGALYVGLSRGRHSNVAHVVTENAVAEHPPGLEAKPVPRSASAVLARAFDIADPQRSALAEAVESAQTAQCVRTPAELLADAAELATAGRTARWLDELVDDGHVSPRQRADLAAEDGANNLTRLLRQAELAGHDPRQVLRTAVEGRTLADARQLTNVLHHRISDSLELDPIGDKFRDWVPKVDDPRWQLYLDQLAVAADARGRELGREALEGKPQWAVEALGRAPEDLEGRREWARRAGIVAAHRELTGHDDPATALGAPPRPGQAEAYASWRAAWRALGRPEADRAEAEMSDGQLRIRVRAWERERTWGPRYVANDLAGTHQAADRHRATAALRAAEADASSTVADRDRLAQESRESQALADLLDARAAELAEADRARGLWYAHTAPTRVAADRASAELAARETEQPVEEPAVTAEEWLAEHRAAAVDQDPHRVVADEVDLAHARAERDVDVATAFPEPPDAPELEQNILRPSPEPVTVDEDVVRVPSAEETAATIARARQALAEIRRRDALDANRAAEESRAEQLTRWHEHDLATEMSVPERALEPEPALGRIPWD
jgi:ribosomal protein S18 acetylase RimI-like enzyme